MYYSAMVSGISGMLFLIPDATAAAESYPLFSCEISVIISSSEVASDKPPFVSPGCDVFTFCSLLSFASLFSSRFSSATVNKLYTDKNMCFLRGLFFDLISLR